MLLAAALCVPIGLERELRGKAAGLRTHVVVGVASAALGAVSLLAAPEGSPVADQTRIAAQVVSGIGFIGAGVVFASGGRVHGLTTAASLWSASATGLVVGLGEPALALALVVVTLLFLWPVDWLSDRAFARLSLDERTFQLVARELDDLTRIQQALTDQGIRRGSSRWVRSAAI
jgi:putative Mg2+ transporter-C (MgtC) family protein